MRTMCLSNMSTRYSLITQYTNTHLIDDFYHIKIEHKVDDDDDEFDEIYKYFKQNTENNCNAKKCAFIERHYRDRGKLDNQYFVGNDDNVEFHDEYIINLISKIHTFFLHSYDINRLTVNEKNMIKEQIEILNESGLDEEEKKFNVDDDDLLNQKRMEMMTLFIQKKKKKLNIEQNDNHKYIESSIVDIDDIKQNTVDFQLIVQLLQDLNMDNIEVQKVKNVLCAHYENEKNKFLTDLIVAFYADNDEALSPLNNISNDTEIRKKIYGQILYKYFKKQDLKNEHFTKLSVIIINKLRLQIDIDSFTEIITNKNNNIDGKILIKGSCTFKSSPKFAQIFKSMQDYKKTNFGKIYVNINKWKPIETKSKLKKEEKNKNAENDEENKYDETQIVDTNKEKKEVYDLGTRYFYWNSHQIVYVILNLI